MISKDEVKKNIESLVEKFNENKEFYLSPEYNETQTRQEFINPFFKALGWDMDNEKKEPEPYKDVIHEDKIYDEKSVKAPDYCFTIYGHKKFFVEAKKPSVLIKEQINPIYQVRRYGWSAGLPVCVLTDFEEFAIYQCTKKPNIKDKPIDERIRYLKYNEYPAEFDYIWEYFSRERVHHGSLEQLIKSDSAKRGTEAVNKEFLKSLEDWRKLLAVNIAIRNANLNEDEINFAVQQTIDRIIFLRICEDRKVEKYGKLQNSIITVSGKSAEAYKSLVKYFKEADEKYNSGIFDFSKDKITSSIIIDDRVIKQIIKELYYPECPYEFSVLPIEILGNAYEQFLGKVIRLTAGHQAKVEEKPEVRKAGGVYYTPQYIVDYIVKNTVGKLIETKTPDEISKIKICDPACGSGSFLIGAYHYLLDYHLYFYTKKYFKNSSTGFQPVSQSSTQSSIGFQPVSPISASFQPVIKEKLHSQDGCATIENMFIPLDRSQSIGINARNLPHWNQSGTTYFVTFRLADSIPQEKLRQWKKEKDKWLSEHPEPVSKEDWKEYVKLFPMRLNAWLDSGMGKCLLRNEKASKIVADALKYFDNDRYKLISWVVMPNHVHVLVCPYGEYSIANITHSWKSFTANEINKIYNCSGKLWQDESFDHIIRNVNQLDSIVEYINNNPIKAKLKEGEYKSSSQSSTGFQPVSPISASFQPVSVSPISASFQPVIKEKLHSQDGCATIKKSNLVYKKSNKEMPITPEGTLTTAEKKRILINNIFGVDIDPQAVEVTKLSLLLKALEGETESSIKTQLTLFNERVLPTLDNNIKCGNSLIGPDFYDSQLELEPKEERKIRAFDWKEEFKEVFKQGGFDCVIGNPPYLKMTVNNINKYEYDYYNSRYKSLKGGSSKNLFQLFIEKAVSLQPKIFSYIIPEALLTTSSNYICRDLIVSNYSILSLVRFNHFVFEQANIGTTIFVAMMTNKNEFTKIIHLANNGVIEEIKEMKIIQNSSWNIFSKEENENIFKKINETATLLKDLSTISKGMVVQNRENFIHQERNRNDLPFLLGNTLKKYFYKYKYYAEYSKLNIIGGTRNYNKHITVPRLFIRRTGSILCASYSDQAELIESTIYFLVSDKINLKYLLGLLNSKLMSFFLQEKLLTNVQGYPQVLMTQLYQLPIKVRNIENPIEKSQHDEIVKHVDTMLALNKELNETKLPADKAQLESRIKYTDKKIDELVYKLYGLTEDEIKIIEGN